MESSVVSDIIDTASSEFFLKREANITVLAADGADAEITSDISRVSFRPMKHKINSEMIGDNISLRITTVITCLLPKTERELILER